MAINDNDRMNQQMCKKEGGCGLDSFRSFNNLHHREEESQSVLRFTHLVCCPQICTGRDQRFYHLKMPLCTGMDEGCTSGLFTESKGEGGVIEYNGVNNASMTPSYGRWVGG